MIALVGLILNPVLIASGQIAMRQMVNINYMVVSSYLNFFVGVVAAIMIFALG